MRIYVILLIAHESYFNYVSNTKSICYLPFVCPLNNMKCYLKVTK